MKSENAQNNRKIKKNFPISQHISERNFSKHIMYFTLNKGQTPNFVPQT